MSDWQPIETAPKPDEGYTRVLLCFDGQFHDSTEPGIKVGFRTERGWCTTCIWASSEAHRAPTGWCPLSPPAESDLLSALKDLLDDCKEYARINNLHNADGSPATHHAMRRAEAAIAKAEGRS